MKTGLDVMKEHGMNIEAEVLTGVDFDNADLPMVVACTSCDMTMTLASPTVRVNDQGYVFCKSCAGE